MPQIPQTTQMYLQQAGATADKYPGDCNQVNITNFVYLRCPKGVKELERKEKAVFMLFLHERKNVFLSGGNKECVRPSVRHHLLLHPGLDHLCSQTDSPCFFDSSLNLRYRTCSSSPGQVLLDFRIDMREHSEQLELLQKTRVF